MRNELMRTTVKAIIAGAMCAAALSGCAPATAGEAREPAREPGFTEVRDLKEPAAAEEAPAAQAADHDQWTQGAAGEAQGDPDGLNSVSGVNHHGGRTETYYSSNVLRHADTGQWTADERGFYRDAEGRYVVAASDMEPGTVFEGSMGECVVLDTGCAEGVTDYYVNW